MPLPLLAVATFGLLYAADGALAQKTPGVAPAQNAPSAAAAGRPKLLEQPSELLPEQPSPLLVYYDFEQRQASGPDTFRLFQRPGGDVDLSRSFRVSGERSLRLSEGIRDGSFSEFLGFFPERQQGVVYAQFYLLLSNPEETFNFALAGSKWFLRFEQHGHAFWLATRDGELVHRPGGEWTSLFRPRAFVWYFVDLAYDVDRGLYDLRVFEEGLEEPVVEVEAQTNTASAVSSSVRLYSFIGDLEDQDDAMFYVDDFLVATDPAVKLRPFVAPGRRSLFVDQFALAPATENPDQLEDVLFHGRVFLRTTSPNDSLPAAAELDQLEISADDALRTGELDLAEELYSRLARDPKRSWRIVLKQADLHFLRGDVRAEQRAREQIYGRLELEEVLTRERLAR